MQWLLAAYSRHRTGARGAVGYAVHKEFLHRVGVGCRLVQSQLIVVILAHLHCRMPSVFFTCPPRIQNRSEGAHDVFFLFLVGRRQCLLRRCTLREGPICWKLVLLLSICFLERRA